MMKWIFGGLMILLMLVNCAGTFLLVRDGIQQRNIGMPAPAPETPDNGGVVGVGGRMNGAFLELNGDFNSGTLSLNHPEVYSLLRQPAFTIDLNNKGVPQFHFWNGAKIQTLDFTGAGGRLRPNSGEGAGAGAIGGAFGLEAPQ